GRSSSALSASTNATTTFRMSYTPRRLSGTIDRMRGCVGETVASVFSMRKKARYLRASSIASASSSTSRSIPPLFSCISVGASSSAVGEAEEWPAIAQRQLDHSRQLRVVHASLRPSRDGVVVRTDRDCLAEQLPVPADEACRRLVVAARQHAGFDEAVRVE